MKLASILLIGAASLALVACDGQPTAHAKPVPESPIATKDTAPMPTPQSGHSVWITGTKCQTGGACVVDASLSEAEKFSKSCTSKSSSCTCAQYEFCSASVTIQINGRQYTGSVQSVDEYPQTGKIKLVDVKVPGNLLMGSGRMYGEGEAIAPLTAETAVADGADCPKGQVLTTTGEGCVKPQ